MEGSGVSLTDYLDANQRKQHMLSLNKHQGFPSENACHLCAKDALMFSPPSISCSSCQKLITLNAVFHRTNNGQITVCNSCFEREGSRISLGGTRYISKYNLQADKNEEVDEEPWVMCDKCQHWVHQICALYNYEIDSDKTKEYICPRCRIGENVVGQKAIPTAAKSLPTTKLSDHLEWRLSHSLRQEAKSAGHDVVPDLVVRVVLAANEKLEVKQQFLNMFKGHQYPAEFPYKSKVILLFQNIEGVDICLFAMYVQEFGLDCREPNSRCVYISYLDSVNHFTPKRKTVAGASLRTFVYHEILIGYLDYCKNLGFTTCYIWACPPTEGYIDGERLSAEDEKVVVDKLLAFHPHSEAKIGCGLDSIMVDRHPLFRQSRCLFVVRTDGGWIDFSYQKCLRAYIRDKYLSHAERYIKEHFKRGSG